MRTPCRARGKRPAGCRPAAAALALLLCGCGPRDPLDIQVQSATEIDLSLWRVHALDRLSREQMADFDEALQQIKFQIMATDSARGPDVAALALQSVNGETVRGVLKRGLSWELRNLETERDVRIRAMTSNAGYIPDPDDARSRALKADLLASQRSVIDEEAGAIHRVTRRLDAAGLPTDLPPLTALDMATPVTPSGDGTGEKPGS
jgi:hypothetical protein